MNAQDLPRPARATPDQRRRRAAANGKLAALRRRVNRIRRGVVALTVALFVAAFGVVYVQLASGHDPALTANERRRAGVTNPTSTTAQKAASTKTSEASASPSSSSEAGSSSESAAKSSESSSSSSSESAGSAVTTKHS